MTAAVSNRLPSPSHKMMREESDDEPMSKQLEILIERRRQEEVRKARFHWSLLRNSIRNTMTAVREAEVKNVLISHGIHHQRKINHDTKLKKVVFMKERDEYLTTDGVTIRLYMSDGRKKKTYIQEEPMDHISYCSFFKQFVGWISGEDELFLMNGEFSIVSQSRAPSTIVLAEYNKHTHEYITVGPGYFTTWAFRYGARHLIPRKMNRTEYKENNMFTHMVLEGTASRSQRIYLSVGNAVAVYNVFDGKHVSYKNNLHERDITAMTFFNPLKYLVTGDNDGTIKIWDNHWHVTAVFLGHMARINEIDIYPHGSAIISASNDCTIRVWNLDTVDEVDRATLDQPVLNLTTTLDYDTFFTYAEKTVDMWKIQHLFHIQTSVGQRVNKIMQTSHPNYSTRTIMISRDSCVRLVSPDNGEVLTTLLLNPSRNLLDVAYSIEDETMFCVLGNGSILKVHTDTNPCEVVSEWPCNDPEREACNYLFVYEYVVDIQLKTDTWGAIKRGITTKTINTDDHDSRPSTRSGKKKNMNRTLLLGGRRDGYIAVYNRETGNVMFKIDAHGSKGVMSMIANAKVDQLISAGKDNVIKVWRVFPFAKESLAPLMSFFCAHLPLHMTMIKTNLCVAFQDHSTATYSVVMYNLRDRKKIFQEGDHYRYDHEPGDDHTESITGLTACGRLKLYASSSLDGTIRVWNETNTLIRLLKLKTQPHSVSFCNASGDLLVGIDIHLYKIPQYAYMPKSYMFRMVSMKFAAPKNEQPLPENTKLICKLSKKDLSRMKNSKSSFKYDTYTDILTPQEEEEINRERKIREKAFSLLEDRENELNKIKNGELTSKKKPKSTVRTKKKAFMQYMKMFYDKPRLTIPKDDLYPEDTVQNKIKEPEPPEEPKYYAEPEPTGFFRPRSEVTRPEQPESSPLKAAYPLTPSGFVPNSILTKILWPSQTPEERKNAEWRLPSFSMEQLDAIDKLKQKDDVEEEEEDDMFAMDWGEPDEAEEYNIYEEKTKSDKSEAKNKFADAMARAPTPKSVDDDDLGAGGTFVRDRTKESTMASSVKQSTDGSQPPTVPSTPREIKPTKPIKKLISRPPPPPPQRKPLTPTPQAPVKAEPTHVRTPSPMPVQKPPRSPSPVPGFISQFKGTDWFDRFFQDCSEDVLPKPWSLENFVACLLKLVKAANYYFKSSIVEAILMLHAQDEFADSLAHMVLKAISSVLNHQKDFPTCMMEEQRNFIVIALKAMQKLASSPDKEFVTEMIVQFLDGDREVRAVVNTILTSSGLHDQHQFLPKELDSWDIWNVEDDNRKADLRKMAHEWLDRWMTTYKLHLEDTIERMKKGQNLHGRMTKGQMNRRGSSQNGHGILRRSVGTGMDDRRGVTVTFDKAPDAALIDEATYMDAVNYFCEMMMEKEMEALRGAGKRGAGSKENVVQAKNTVLVLPKVPHKPCLVRLGETHTSRCKPQRETNLHTDYRMPIQTSRGYHPVPGQISGFVNSINLPMKPLLLNIFPNEIDAYDARYAEPILITLKSSQKYFIPSQSIVPQEAIAAAL